MSKARKPSKFSRRTPKAVETISVDDSQFRAIADYTYDWESWHSPDGPLIWVNRAVERMTGRSVTECATMKDYPLPIVVAEDRDRVAKVLISAVFSLIN